MEKVNILIVDDNQEVRDSIRQMVALEEKFSVVGTAKNGLEAIDLAERLKPDVILMDINMPEKDGIAATEEITLKNPHIAIVILSAQGEQEYLRKAMSAGARDYLVKPFSPDQLMEAIIRSKDFMDKRFGRLETEGEKREKIVISVFGTKGGVGRSVLSTNLAVEAARQKQCTVLLIDLNLEFGDVPLLFDTPVTHSLADVADSVDFLDGEVLSGLVLPFKEMAESEESEAKIELLAGTATPAAAETITAALVEKALTLSSSLYEVVLIDLPVSFKDTTLVALDHSDKVLMVTTPDVPTIKNTRLALDVMRTLEYSEEKVFIVLNRAESQTGITRENVEEGLGMKVSFLIPSDGHTVLPSVNKGKPFLLTDVEKPISVAIIEMAASLLGIEGETVKKKSEKKKGLFPFLKK